MKDFPPYLDYPKEYKPQTNGETIRSMSDYDLADWIDEILTYHSIAARKNWQEECSRECPLYECCNDQPTDNIEGWLGLPAKG